MYPIIEFDSDSKPVISPSLYYKTLDRVEHCVICFFKEVIEKVIRENNAVIKATLRSEIGENLNTHISTTCKNLFTSLLN